jgi:ribose transport system substrate-binding protein
MIFARFLLIFLFCTQVFAAVAGKPVWKGPQKGPAAQQSKTIYFIASDLKNGGVLSVSQAFEEAAQVLKWKVEILNASGSRLEIRNFFEQAIKNHVDGIVLGGFDAGDFLPQVKKAKAAGIGLVGWHASATPGPAKSLFTNITTDPKVVAFTASSELAHVGSKKGGVIIITDRRFTIATVKTLEMKKVIESMPNFKLIAVEDVSISNAETEIPRLVKGWNQRYGSSWTHTLAINDIYFDTMGATLDSLQRKDVANIAAGDGSIAAIHRIREGTDPQLITIAEPLAAQGWQIADELNRYFAQASPSGFLTDVIVVSKEYLSSLKSKDIESGLKFRQTYTRIWRPNSLN